MLVNNAGIFIAGCFEDLAPELIARQLATNLMGPINVARAVLPVMAPAAFGHIVAISSGAGLAGLELCSAVLREAISAARDPPLAMAFDTSGSPGP